MKKPDTKAFVLLFEMENEIKNDLSFPETPKVFL